MPLFFSASIFFLLAFLPPLLGFPVAFFALLAPGVLDLVDGNPEARVTDMLLAHEMIINSLLCVTDNEKGATRVAHFHGLLRLQAVLLFEERHNGTAEALSFFPQLIGELHESLSLLDVPLAAGSFCLLYKRRDTLAQELYLFLGVLVLPRGGGR